MSQNGDGWPSSPRPPQSPRPQPSRGFQDPRGIPQRPPRSHRLPDGDAWRPDEYLRPLPPGYEPVHHEPRYDDPRPARPQDLGRPRDPEDSPWRRTQRLSRPEAEEWHPGQPAQASNDPADFRPPDQYEERSPYSERGHYGEPGDVEYEDEYGAGGRFVPGFGDDGDADYENSRPDRRARHGRQDSRGGGRGGRRRRRRFGWIAPLAALLIIVTPLAVGGVYAYSLYQSKYHPADYSGDGTGSVVVQVPSGASASSLGPELVKLGVVASSRAFVLAAEHSSNPAGLLPGFYGMHKRMQASLAYALLLNPKNLVQVTVTIPEGWRLSQTLAWLGAKSGIPASAYAAALKNPASLGLPSYANGKPEGYLFPATYEVLPHETALGVLKGMVQRFDQEAATVNLPVAAGQVHLSQGQVITMASLVQAEGGRLSDYPKIARVIYNRLVQGIPLQLDSTVLYGLNTFGILASDQQLNSPSPYNTYRHMGLTPGPIDSPGNAAIQAVLHPASGNWLYFVTVSPKTGETLFTSSETQFEQFRQELQKNLGQGQGGTGG